MNKFKIADPQEHSEMDTLEIVHTVSFERKNMPRDYCFVTVFEFIKENSEDLQWAIGCQRLSPIRCYQKHTFHQEHHQPACVQ